MNRWSRLAALSGVLFTGLMFATAFSAPATPNSDASGRRVISFFVEHRSSELASTFLGLFAALFFLFFAASLRAHLKARSAPDGLVALGFGGAIAFSVGLGVLMGLNYALADVPAKLTPASAQAINVISNDTFFPFLIGAGAFLIGSGLAIARSTALPQWLGWTAFVLGVASVTPIGWFAILVGALWVTVVAVLMYLREGRPVAPPPAPEPVAAHA